MRISIIPPASSAFDLYRAPKIFPILTPIKEHANVTIPIKETAGMISTLKKAKVTPMARASMLVATASTSIDFISRESLQHSCSLFKASRIILIPMIPSSIKAIQWSILVMYSLNCTPRKYPISGIPAWNIPK